MTTNGIFCDGNEGIARDLQNGLSDNQRSTEEIKAVLIRVGRTGKALELGENIHSQAHAALKQGRRLSEILRIQEKEEKMQQGQRQ